MFLFAMEGQVPSPDKYEFVPYHYGACSFDIFDDLRRLEAASLITSEPAPWATYSTFALTQRGADEVTRLTAVADQKAVKQLQEARAFVTQRSFQQLLRDVYARYPAYAKNSLWRHLAPPSAS